MSERTIASVLLGLALVAVLVLAATAPAEARVTQILIDRVDSPTFGGASFGAVGQYEKIVGRAFGEVAPTHALNAGTVNIDRAPVNSGGTVEYVVDIYILKPVDMARGNRTIFY